LSWALGLASAGNPDVLRNLINFHKRRLLYKVISEILLYQPGKYDIQPIPEILQIAASLPSIVEKELYNLSLQREPRDCEKSDIAP
jgi:hypothetical protein